MLIGRFGSTSGRPYLEGRLHLYEHGIVGDVSFLVDTGADKTVLMPGDGLRLDVDYSRLAEPVDLRGIGGEITGHVENAVLVFDDGERLCAFQAEIVVAEEDGVTVDVPSLLGRDVIDRLRMTYDKSTDALEFVPVSGFTSIPLPEGWTGIAASPAAD